MNRRERRKMTKVGDIVEIKLGRVTFRPGEDCSRDVCYLCGKPATAWFGPRGMAHGFADINGQKALLCETCFSTENETCDAIMRKYWDARNLKIADGGTYASADKLRRDIANATKERSNKPTN